MPCLPRENHDSPDHDSAMPAIRAMRHGNGNGNGSGTGKGKCDIGGLPKY